MGPLPRFKIGDKIRCVQESPKYEHWNDTCRIEKNDLCTVIAYSGMETGQDRIDVRVDGVGINHNVPSSRFELRGSDIKIKKTIMTSIIDKVKLSLKSEPKKTLIQRGMLDSNESLTCEGHALLEHILVEKYGDDMRKAVDSVPVEKTS